MEGMRKVIIAVITLALESGAFALVTLVGKNTSEGVLIAYFGAVVAALAVFTGGNVASKSIAAKQEEKKP